MSHPGAAPAGQNQACNLFSIHRIGFLFAPGDWVVGQPMPVRPGSRSL
jgi:hypothetical protein